MYFFLEVGPPLPGLHWMTPCRQVREQEFEPPLVPMLTCVATAIPTEMDVFAME
jgi:hypothetical protein